MVRRTAAGAYGTIDAVESLALIQRHTSTVIRVPDFAAIPSAEVGSWLITAKILRGEDVTMTYCINVVLDTGIAVPEGELGIMTVDVGKQRIDLGMVEVWLTDPCSWTAGSMRDRCTTPSRHPTAAVHHRRPTGLHST